MKASIALQVLPLSQGVDRIAIIDQVIAYLQAQSVTMVVTPFETVLDFLMIRRPPRSTP